VDIAGYGGAAGGSKTFGLLIECLRNVGVKGFGAVIFRRSCPQITNEGALWDTSSKIYSHILGAAPKSGEMSWSFPSGSKIRFHHLQYDESVYEHQGSQVCLLAWDELTHFSEFQFFYMLSRNRSTCGVRPYVRATCNPDGSSWVKRLFAPWVDKGFPTPAADGEVRWMMRLNDRITWVDKNFRPPTGEVPKSVTFIHSSVYDNVDLMEADPGYLSNLLALPPVERARLLDGDWDILTDRFFDEWLASRPDGSPWHVIPDGPVNPADKHYLCIDYGFGAPWCCYLIGFDHDGRCTVYRELYGVGRKSSDQAIDMIDLCRANGVDPSIIKRAGHDAFARQRNSEGSTDAIADIWRRTILEKYGDKARRWVSFAQGGGTTGSPLHRAAQWREYLSDWGPTEFWPKGRPGIQIMAGCVNLIRTLPVLKADKHNTEVVDTTMDDHAFDAIGNELEHRPGKPKRPEVVVDDNPRSLMSEAERKRRAEYMKEQQAEIWR
jgi:hypothetical protein